MQTIAFQTVGSVLAVLLLTALISGACTTRADERDLSRSDALQLLDRAVNLSESQQWDALCLLPGGEQPRNSCLNEATHPDFPPPTGDPVVIGERRLSDTEIVLKTCVQTPAGPVHSEFYVLNHNGDVIAPHPVYWFPRTITDPDGGGTGISPVPTGQPTEAACPK